MHGNHANIYGVVYKQNSSAAEHTRA